MVPLQYISSPLGATALTQRGSLNAPSYAVENTLVEEIKVAVQRHIDGVEHQRESIFPEVMFKLHLRLHCVTSAFVVLNFICRNLLDKDTFSKSDPCKFP